MSDHDEHPFVTDYLRRFDTAAQTSHSVNARPKKTYPVRSRRPSGQRDARSGPDHRNDSVGAKSVFQAITVVRQKLPSRNRLNITQITARDRATRHIRAPSALPNHTLFVSRQQARCPATGLQSGTRNADTQLSGRSGMGIFFICRSLVAAGPKAG
jgi:hypothetical protein